MWLVGHANYALRRMFDLDTAEWAVAVAAVSFFLSFVVLVWNILNATLLDRARLKVRIWAGAMPESKDVVHHAVTFEAANIGKRPVQLSELWISTAPDHAGGTGSSYRAGASAKRASEEGSYPPPSGGR